MRTLAQIDARLAEIRTALQNPETTDLDTLQNEMNQLLQERAQRVAEAEQRRSMLEAIANSTAQGITPPANLLAPPNGQNETHEERDVLATPEYRTAFLRSLMGLPLSAIERAAMDEAEQRAALTSASSSAAPIFRHRRRMKLFDVFSRLRLLLAKLPCSIFRAMSRLRSKTQPLLMAHITPKALTLPKAPTSSLKST